jgi:hypothetical protein
VASAQEGRSRHASGPEVTALLSEQHREFRRSFAELRAMREPLARRDALERLSCQLSKHEAAEAMAVYPVVAHLASGPELRARALADERQTARLLANCLRKSFWRPRSRGLRRLLCQLEAALDEHASYAEEMIFPVLRLAEDERKRRMMGTWIENAESIGPTRPHPHGPQRLPGLIALLPVLAVLDRLRDAARRRVETPPKMRS